MGWRSYLFRSSDKTISDAKHGDENLNTPHIDRAAPSDRHQQIVAALEVHLKTVYRSHRGDPAKVYFDPNLNLYEAGYLDSLSASEFLLLAEQQYALPLPDWLIGGQVNTLAALAEYIATGLAGAKS
jgi:acyl carrier protein